MSIVEFKDVNVILAGKVVLESISFSIAEPYLTAVIGPNGAGKTTLLKTVLGLISPVKGEVRVLGMNPVTEPAVRKLIGYVPQRERIDPMTPVLVRDIVLMGRLVKKGFPRRVRREDFEKSMEAAELLDVEDLWSEPYAHLSGGQQQRVLVARALASEPHLLLLDEPFSAVDMPTSRFMVELFRRLVDERGMTVMLVAHEINPILNHVDRLMLLNRRLIAYGKLKDVLNERLLEETYLRRIRVMVYEGEKMVMGVDSHA